MLAKRTLRLSTAAALAMLAGGAAWAERSQDEGEAPDLFLERRIHQSLVVEQYVSQVMAPFRQADVGFDGLDGADVEAWRQQRQANERAQNLSQVFRLDLNADLVVTPDEVERSARREGDRERPGRELDRFDVDGDGNVTIKEVMVSSARISRVNELRRADDVDALMRLKAASDGRLTAAELEDAARKAFAKADLNGDGRISRDEAETFRTSLPKEPPRRADVYDVYCPLPPAAKGDLVVLYGAYEGREARGHGRHPTGTATIQIEPGRQPIYLVLPSYEAIQWTLIGATQRVRQVVLTSYEEGDRATPRGVNGVPSQHVRVYRSEGCVRHFYEPDGAEAKSADAGLALQIGRRADVIAGAYKATEVSLPFGKPLAKANDAK